jgi:hypothetical protein
MTPKEKAKELFDKFLMQIPNNEMSLEYEASIQCALIACKFALENPLNSDEYNKYLNEIINEIEFL